MDDLAVLVADLRDPKSAGHLGALDRVRFKGGETRLGGKDLGEPDPNAGARAAVVRALAQQKRRDNVPVLHLLLREEAISCKKQWGGSELLHEIGLALAALAEPMSVPVLMWAMDQSFDCYSMLDEDVMRPFFTPKTLDYLRQQIATADPARRDLARKGEKYLQETFGGA